MKHKIVIFRIAHVNAMSAPMPIDRVQDFIDSIEKIGAIIIDIVNTGRGYETRIDNDTYACMSAYTYTEDDMLVVEEDDEDEDEDPNLIIEEDN